MVSLEYKVSSEFYDERFQNRCQRYVEWESDVCDDFSEVLLDSTLRLVQ